MFCCYCVEKCEINLDFKFGDIVVIKFMNFIMYDGKKLIVECIVYGVFDVVENKICENLIEVFYVVFENVML